MNLLVITEQHVEQFADYPALIGAMEEVFMACAREQIDNYPFVRSTLRNTRDVFGIKSGCNYVTGDLGLKCGGYWNDNPKTGIDRHQSTILLLDIHTGRPTALVAGNNLTALRTAAAAAAAARCLARKDSTHVAVLGTGRQAFFQLQALCEIRPIQRVSAWSRSMERTDAFGRQARSLGLDFIAARTPAAATRKADIIVTVTPSQEPLIHLPDVSPGVHINAMGSDTQGKRELSTDLLEAGRIWADDIRQARIIGECQHLASLANVSDVGSLLINASAFERRHDEITIFDGTGLALQDLAAARLIMSTAMKHGCAQAITL